MKKKIDECWICGRDINEGDEYVDVTLHRMGKRKKVLVHRACKKCAKKERMMTKSSYDALVEDGMWK